MPLPLILTLLLLTPHPSTPESTLPFQISESAPPSTLIGRINSTPPYLIVPVPGSYVDSDLTIDPQTGSISTKVKLDRETRNKYTFVALPPTGENIRVVINVLDENDNAPTFPRSTVTLEFPENTPRDVKRTLPPARDLDLGIYNTQRYVITSGNVNNAFRLSSHRERDGVLYLDLQVNGFLDRETTPDYNLVIEAYDGGQPALKSTLNVKIKIEDVNDNSPVFNQSKYFATISENVTIGTRVLQVFATDTDSGLNSKISYSINRRQTDRESNFKINSTTGIISTNKILDFEIKELHELVIVARDSGTQPLETTVFVSIRVIDVKDNELNINIFYLDNGRVSEKASIGEFIARVSVSEGKIEKKTAVLSIDSDTFTVEKRNNVDYIVTKKLLDRESIEKYDLILKATDGGLKSNINVTIVVTDVNDCPPQFEKSEYQIDILESVQIGTSVLKVTAIDKDLDKVIYYGIGNELFSIDENGVIKTNSVLKCEEHSTVKFKITAKDVGGLMSSADMVVNVFDGNDHGPVFEFSFYNVSLEEGDGDGRGRCFMNVTATDPDCGLNSIINYTIRGDPGPFKIGSSGQICLAGELDYEKQRVYELSVVAEDRGHLTTSTLVKINVLDSNDNYPLFTHSNMSTKIGSSITVLATDADSGLFGQIKYKILNSTTNYVINGTTGEISGKSQIPEHLLISAMDGGGLETRASVYIGDGCSSWRFEVMEDVNVGMEIGRVEEKAESYQIQPISSQFSIDNKGLIRTTQKLDREVQPSVLLNIQAVTGSRTSHCQVTILILDTNDNPPKFKSNSATITLPENTQINTPIYAVYATDPDYGPNSQIKYKLNSNTFKVDDSGTITLKSSLDYETVKSYHLIITAEDSGSPMLHSNMTVIVQVQDLNDNRPLFKEIEQVKVQEDVPIGTVITEVFATDSDTGNNGKITYSLIGDSDFIINSNTGTISTAKFLDRETNPKYVLKIKATDHGQPQLSSTATLTILIQDTNDNGPEFKREYEFELDENNRIGFEVGEVVAVDRDAGENGRVEYTVEDGVPFSIGRQTGKLTATKRLDREQESMYEIQVTASDLGDPSRQTTTLVTIKIRDQNDNHPVINGDGFITREGVEDVGTVSASDKDSGDNSKLVYGIVGGSADFTINKHTGLIRSKVKLDSEKTYTVNVKVKDKSVKPLEATREFRIKVLNEDRLLERRFTVEIPEDTPPGSLIFTIPTQHQYNLDPNPTFQVNKTTGAIYTTNFLDYESIKNYTLKITSQNTISELTIKILDRNDNRPTFPSDYIQINIPEDTQLNNVIINLTATDLDSGSNGAIRYIIIAQSPEFKFRVNKLSGVVVLNQGLDYEIETIGYFIVMATDQCEEIGRRLSSTITVKYAVQNVNDNRPVILSQINNTADTSFNVIAEDKDGDELIFSMKESPYFEIDRRGRILITKEFSGSMEYNVSVTDGKYSDFQIGRVTVGGHTVLAPYYNATVLENCRVGTEVVRIGGGSQNGDHILPASSPSQFAIHPKSGQIYVTSKIDRELNPNFTLYPHVISNSKIISSTTVHITVRDSNDNSPDFYETCENLLIPENQEFSIIHTFRAVDKDTGRNAELTYTLIGGDNLFTVDLHSGELKAKTLDRERTAVHEMVVVAQDRGLPVQRKSCNFSVIVGDENDEEPEFTKQIYSAHVFENAGIGTTVLTVRATDGDTGKNSEIKYSLSNESDWHFRVDNRTGVVTTAGPLDREKTSTYTFEITATDGGLYDARSSKTIVKITIRDVNDNRPNFLKNPTIVKVPSAVAGQNLVKIEASDSDEGVNGEVVYSLPDTTLFRINPTTGVISPVVSLDSGRQFNLQVIARDKGTPSLSTAGLVVVQVGHFENQIKLREEYNAELKENSGRGTKVVELQPTTAQKQITYKIIGEDYGFEIVQTEVIVRDPILIDRERIDTINLVVEARTESHFDWTVVKISITDENDNPPIFNQNSYFAAVWEGNNKGTFVAQVTATDPDSTHTPLLYQIIEGNQDNAFIIDHGLVKTNIVLDRETLDNYKITIIATDEGQPQLTGTTTLIINVIDINDTPPTFPPSTTVKLGRDTKIGTNVIQLAANDVDANPNLFYTVNSELFSVGKYSGKVWLKEELNINEIVQVVVSDGVHLATTELSVEVIGGNEHWPEFLEPVKNVKLGENSQQVQFKATDSDPGINGIIKYTIRPMIQNVTIEEESGLVTVSSIGLKNLTQFTITATDGGGKSAEATLWLEPADQMRFDGIYRTSVTESARPGTAIYNFDLTGHFELTGNEGLFSIDSSGQLITTSNLDREAKSNYTLGIKTQQISTEIVITILDENDNPPYTENQNITVSELKQVGSILAQLTTEDLDETSTEFTYEIVTCPDLFKLTLSGQLTLAKNLDYETSKSHSCSILTSDGKFNSISLIQITVLDENDHEPKFPMNYVESIPENSPAGTITFQARAIDLDSGIYSKLNYSTDSDYFSVDTATGHVKSKIVFDYESDIEYNLKLTATDIGGRSTVTNVKININPIDEYAPEFKKSYNFVIPGNAYSGYVIGTVQANDKDSGIDGVINYTVEDQNYDINQNGEIVLRGDLTNGTLIVTAKSTQLTTSTSVRITTGPDNAIQNIYLIIIIIVIIIITMVTAAVIIIRRRQQPNAKESSDPYNPSFDTLEYVQSVEQRQSYSPSEPDHSSGRGSAEDMEDEEIAMINELQAEMPAKNAQEYFARLGIRPKQIEEDNDQDVIDGVDISNLIYSQIVDDFPVPAGSVSVKSEEGTGWDYLLDWGPQYQPLASVFAEIAEMGNNNITSPAESRIRQQMHQAPRSPISHDCSSGPISPSFTPALSPLSNCRLSPRGVSIQRYGEG